MKKILCITSNFPRWHGDSTTPFVLNLSKDLIQLGWEVDVIAPHTSGAKIFEILEGVPVSRFPYLWPYALETICYQGGALVNLRKSKSNYIKLPFLISAQLLNIFQRIVTHKYDIIHSHWILPQGFNGVIASKTFNIPHVLTVHGGDIFGLQKKLFNMAKKKVLQHVDAVTVNSTVTKNAVFNLTQESKNLHLIPMGVSTSTDSPKSLSEKIKLKYRRGKGPLIVYVGRIVDEKGIEDLLKAVMLLSDKYRDLSAVIVGEGQDRIRMEHHAHEMGLASRVFFTGWQNPDLIYSYLSAGDIFVGPSRLSSDGWVEAQGLSFIEAMISRTPVIATKIGGIVDSVVDGETGLLVNERAPEEIAQAIIKLTEDAHLRKSVINNGYRLASTKFSRSYSARQFSELFNSLLRQPQ